MGKFIANRLSRTVEKLNLLPEEQMRARPNKSKISAVELLIEQIHFFQGQNKKNFGSLLSLDIAGAFYNVPHKRVIHNKRTKDNSKRITDFIELFSKERITSVTLGRFKSDYIPTLIGIPQESPLSPILFLFFISTLLLELRFPQCYSVGFVDDTNILAWSNFRIKLPNTDVTRQNIQ